MSDKAAPCAPPASARVRHPFLEVELSPGEQPIAHANVPELTSSIHLSVPLCGNPVKPSHGSHPTIQPLQPRSQTSEHAFLPFPFPSNSFPVFPFFRFCRIPACNDANRAFPLSPYQCQETARIGSADNDIALLVFNNLIRDLN